MLFLRAGVMLALSLFAAGASAEMMPPPQTAPQSVPVTSEPGLFTLQSVALDGTGSLPIGRLQSIWQGDVGKPVSSRRLAAIADAISAVYASAGFALYTVTVPAQRFDNGVVHIVVAEGYVDEITIDGDVKGADLSLVNAAVHRIVVERPLRRMTVERNVLLINAIAGVKADSRFEPIAGRPGAVRLHLVLHRKTFEAGIGFDNQGAAILSRVQMNVNTAVNSVLREGDRTQLVFGFPIGINRYQYYGVSQVEPIGTDGVTATFSMGDLVTHAIGTGNEDIGGNALIGSARIDYPIIVAVAESLTASASLDFLNSNNAVFGNTISDERTRALRLGVTYARQDRWAGIDAASLTFSEGINGLGARQGNAAYGGPQFSKVNVRLAREQPLPDRFVIRARAAGQYSPNRLPSSEDFTYGGLDFGQAFPTAALYGDRGISILAELAWREPDEWQPSWLSVAEIFTSGDWARTWNARTIYAVPADDGASAGIGWRGKFFSKVTAQVEAAKILVSPMTATSRDGWQFVAAVSGGF